MRLIDADELQRDMCELVVRECDDMGIGFMILDLVKSQPTAYDVDAVVSELENMIERYEKKEKQIMEKGAACQVAAANVNGIVRGLKLAVYTIKRGGRNE